MPTTMRSFLSVLTGCVAAFVHIGVIELVSSFIYPLPEGFDPSKPETVAAYMKAIPLGAMVMVLVAWGVGTFAGAWVTARLAPGLTRSRRIHGMVVGLLFLVAALGTMAGTPHPIWFWWVSLALFPTMAGLGCWVATLGGNRAPGPSEPEVIDGQSRGLAS